MGSEDSTDSSVSAQKEKGTKFGSLLKGAFGSMAKAVKGSKPEKRFFGREKVKDDYIESLECINGIHSNNDPELPDITKRNVMPGRFAKVEAPKVRTEIRPKTYEVMDEMPVEQEEMEDDLEIVEDLSEEPLTVSEVRTFVEDPVTAEEPVIFAEPAVFVREDDSVHGIEFETETEDECEVDYFDFLPPMKATERAPVRRAPQVKPSAEEIVDADDIQEEAESEEAEEEVEDHGRTKEEVFIDIFDDVPGVSPISAAEEVHEVSAVTVDEVQCETRISANDIETTVSTEIDLDILDVPTVFAVEVEETIVKAETIAEAEIEEQMEVEVEAVAEAKIEEVIINIFDDDPEVSVCEEIDLDILDVPVTSAVQEEEIECAEFVIVPDVRIPTETTEVPVIQETQHAVPEAAIPAYGHLSIDFDAFDRAAESPLDARFDVEEVEHIIIPQTEVSFDMNSLESVSVLSFEAEAESERIDVQVSPINVEIDFASLETPVSPINVEIDFASLETPVSPINVEIDTASLTAARMVTEMSAADHASYVPNFILLSDEDVVETKTGSELSDMMPETILRAFDSEPEFLEIDVLDVAEESCDMEIDESEITDGPNYLEIDISEMMEFLEIDETEITEIEASVQNYLEIDESEITEIEASVQNYLEIDESEITDGPNYLEIDISEMMEFLEIDETEITEIEASVQNYLEIDESEITEIEASVQNYLEIDESEITDGPNYLEIDISEMMEFLEIDETEITEIEASVQNYMEIDASEVMEFLEIDESEITDGPNYLEIDISEMMEFLEIDESEVTEIRKVAEPNCSEIDASGTEVPGVYAIPVREAKVFASAETTEEKGGIFFSFFTKEDKEDNISISFGEVKEDDDVMDDSNESVSARDDYAVTVSPTDGSRKLFI